MSRSNSKAVKSVKAPNVCKLAKSDDMILTRLVLSKYPLIPRYSKSSKLWRLFRSIFKDRIYIPRQHNQLTLTKACGYWWVLELVGYSAGPQKYIKLSRLYGGVYIILKYRCGEAQFTDFRPTCHPHHPSIF